MKHDLKRYYIKKVFTDLNELKLKGIYFSGIKKDGKYKQWGYKGQLLINSFYNKNNKLEGEYKMWWEDGQLRYHELYKDGRVIKDYLK